MAPLRRLLAVPAVLALAGACSGSSEVDRRSEVASRALGAVGTLDSTVVHDLAVTMDEDGYRAVLDAYADTGDKEWIEATVTIDGETYEQAGLRLKGNSSLRGLGGATDTPDPATLPWLIRLDEYVDQDHHGLTELVVRSNGTETALNEAVALELLERAGLASQDAIATRFSVNGGEPVLRLVVDHPTDEWMAERFDAPGALYKAESTGDWTYRGDDPDAYDEVFDQEAGEADLDPLITLLRFVEESDDAAFEAELPEHLDVDAFATYLAMEELLANFDDIDGPGNNAYLYLDTATGQFTVVPWDHNLAFGTGFPDPGAGGPGGNRPAPGGGEGPGRGERPGGRANPLVSRFLAVATWADLVAEREAELRAALYDGGVASEVLAQWVQIVGASGLVDEATVQAESAVIAAQLA